MGNGTGNTRGGQAGITITGAATETKLLPAWSGWIGTYEAPRNSSTGGNSMSPTHVVMSNKHYRSLLTQVGTDDHFLDPAALSGSVSALWGIQIVLSDYINDTTNNGEALLLNLDPSAIQICVKRGLTRRYGLDSGDLKAGRQSVVYSWRWNVVLRKPRSACQIRNLDRKSSGYTP